MNTWASPYSLSPPGCPICSSNTQLLRCGGCKVVSYCGTAHQTAHRRKHKADCSSIKKARETLEREDAALRALPSDFMRPADVFNSSVGHFWGILDTRDYMRARFALADALLRINTAAAVDQALGHFTDMLRLNRSDNLGVRDIIPCLLLRLGREQECYNFLKWWAIYDHDDDNATAPYVDFPRANAFEPIDALRLDNSTLSLSQLVILTLLKLRLYLDVSVFEGEFGDVCEPDPVIDRPVGSLARARMRSHRDLSIIDTMKGQYRQLCRHVYDANPHFWSLLVDESAETPAPPAMYTEGSIEEANLALYQCKRAWDESEDAVTMIDADTAALTSVYQGPTSPTATTDDVSRLPGGQDEMAKKRGTGKVFPSKFTTTESSDPYDTFHSARSVDRDRTVRLVSENDRRKVLVFTDGACANNGQPDARAGWAVIYGPPIRCGDFGEKTMHTVSGRLESQGPFGDDSIPTSNRAELRAAIGALRICDWRGEGFDSIVIATDSAYVVNGATAWATGWVRNGWKISSGGDVKNRDLWELFLGEVERWSERGLRVELWRIPRTFNKDADEAAKKASWDNDQPDQFRDIIVTASVEAPTATDRQSPRVLGLCLENEALFLDVCGGLVSEITKKAKLDRAASPEAALAALNQEPRPTVILIADGGLTRHRKVLERVIDLLRDGATVVMAGIFSSFVNQGQFDRLFATIGLPWTRGSYYRTTQKLHRDVVGNPLASRLPSACSQKALYVKQVERSAVWYTADDNASEASAVFARVGSGRLGYVGDVNSEDSSTKIVLAMCGLLG